MKSRLSLALIAAAALPLIAQGNGSPPKDSVDRTVNDGVFSEAQAAQGEGVFRATCASCHVPSDHTGDTFKLNWLGRTIFDYFKLIKTTMPDDNIGGLSDDDYTRVTTYLLMINGYRAGPDSLPSDTVAMKRIRITAVGADSVKPRTRR